ncbi:MAG: hypothetical protein IKJ85_07070 [Firmicutes bacterium]|nr:hypothetical protein [Bacillota bacterium]
MANLKHLYRLFFAGWLIFFGKSLFDELFAYNYIDPFFILFHLFMITVGAYGYYIFMNNTARLVCIYKDNIRFVTFNDKEIIRTMDDLICLYTYSKGYKFKFKTGKKITVLNSLMAIQKGDSEPEKRNLSPTDFPDIERRRKI